MEILVTTGAIRRAKLQSNLHHQQTQHPTFYRPGALPVAQPTVSCQSTEGKRLIVIVITKPGRSSDREAERGRVVHCCSAEALRVV